VHFWKKERQTFKANKAKKYFLYFYGQSKTHSVMPLKKYFLFFFTCFYFWFSDLIAQENREVDSLLRQLEERNMPDSTRMELLSNLTYVHQTISPEKSFRYIEEGLALAQAKNDKKYTAEFLAHLGNTNWYIGDYPNALYNILQALKINESLNNKKGIAKNLNSLGLIYDNQGDLKKALSYYEQAIELDKERNDSTKLSVMLNNIGVIYQKQRQLKKALVTFFEALATADRQDNKYLIGVSLNNIGDTYYEFQEYSASISWQKKALVIEQKIQDNEGIAYSYNAIGKVYSALNKLDSAEYYALTALAIATKYQFKPQIKEILLNLKGISFAKGNFKKAIIYADSAMAMTENLFGEDKNKAINQLQQRYELGKKETEIESLQKDNRIKEIQIENQHLWRNIWIINLGVAVAFILGLVFLYSQRVKTNKRLNKINQELNGKNQELHKLNATKDKLFSIISHDLRSPFGTLKSTLELMKENAFSPLEIEKVSSLLHQNVENISYTLDNLLQWSVSQMAGGEVRIEHIKLEDIMIETVNFYSEVARQKGIDLIILPTSPTIAVKADRNQLRLIMRNLLNNAIKFTFPKGKVTISAQIKEQEAEISVVDTGVGMSEERLNSLFFPASRSTNGTSGEKGTGLGLLLVKDFVENNQGKITVHSTQYHGTSFTFTLKIA
jgi:two-component system, sensor histidine kinase and response regulator